MRMADEEKDMSDEKPEPWITPQLMVQYALMLVGGMTVYYGTISEIRIFMAESKADRVSLQSRVAKVENISDSCITAKFRAEQQEKEIDNLQQQIRDLNNRLQDHDGAIRKTLPLGKRSDIEPLKVN
jgi:hypothetical protein